MAKPVKYRVVRSLLNDNEWTLLRQVGSHQTWQDPEGSSFTIFTRDGDVQPAQIAELKRRLKRSPSTW
jgi:predicted RNA binding protein YcfA (HicA-like mRNA interferase family)